MNVQDLILGVYVDYSVRSQRRRASKGLATYSVSAVRWHGPHKECRRAWGHVRRRGWPCSLTHWNWKPEELAYSVHSTLCPLALLNGRGNDSPHATQHRVTDTSRKDTRASNNIKKVSCFNYVSKQWVLIEYPAFHIAHKLQPNTNQLWIMQICCNR